MSELKVIEGLEPWEVMKRASEGERWAYHPNTLVIKSHWMEPKHQSILDLAKYISQCFPVAIIDTTTPVIEWDKFNYDFFNQYGGVNVSAPNDNEYQITKYDTTYDQSVFTLVPSPFYPWFGSECPVPDNLEVEYKLRDGATFTDKASKILHWEWDHTGPLNLIVFRLTGNVL